MTTFIVSMLVIISIIAIARYYGDSSMASNLLLTLAFSVVVGLGIQFLTKEKLSKKGKMLRLKNSSMIVNPASTQAVCIALEPVQTCQSGFVSQMQDITTKEKEFPQIQNNKFVYNKRITTIPIDSS